MRCKATRQRRAIMDSQMLAEKPGFLEKSDFQKVYTMIETNALRLSPIESDAGFLQPRIELSHPTGNDFQIGRTDESASPEAAARRLTRLLSLLDLFQTLNHHVKVPEILAALTQNLTCLFRFQVFGILWMEGSRLQMNLYPVEPVNQAFVADTMTALLHAYSDAQALSPNVQIADPAIPSGIQNRDLLTTPTEFAAEKVADPATFARVNSHLTLPLITSGKAIGAATLCNMRAAAYSDEDAQIFGMLAGHLATTLEHAVLFQRLEELAVTDGLTQLYNHTHFYKVLDQEISRAQRYDQRLSLILLDVDDFKQVNDTYGHQAGDAVLQELAAIIRSVIRQVDIAARDGGDEFAILMPQTDLPGAMGLAARLQQQVTNHRFVVGPTSIRLTLSLGIAALGEQTKYKVSLVREADLALYQEKQEKKRPVSERLRKEPHSALGTRTAFSYATRIESLTPSPSLSSPNAS